MGWYIPQCRYYYFPLYVIIFLTCSDDVQNTSLFVIVYLTPYSTQSPNTALLSCLLRTLGIVNQFYPQYIQLLTSDSSCLRSSHIALPLRSSALAHITDVSYFKSYIRFQLTVFRHHRFIFWSLARIYKIC